MANSLRPEEMQWFEITARFFKACEEKQAEFDAFAAFEELKTEFFSDVQLTELTEIDAELWRIFLEMEIPKEGKEEHPRMFYLSWLADTFRYATFP